MGTAKLGDVIEVWCRYCKLNLDANVSALAPDGGIAKVQCRTCRHFQDHKEPVPDSVRREKLVKKVLALAERRGARPPGALSRPTTHEPLSAEAVARAMWEEATKDASPMKIKTYDEHRRYAPQDMVAHKAFGLGVVHEVRDEDDTLLVLFRDGYQRIEHNRPRDEE